MTTARTYWRAGARARTIGMVVTSAGAIVLIAGLLLDPAAIAMSYLAAYMATLAVVVGMLLLVMIAHLSGAIWFVLLRRQAEAVVGSLPALAVLALPMVLAPQLFWPWAAPFETLPASMQEALRPKLAYFHPAFFTARAVLYWVVWLAGGELLWRMSRRQDAGAVRPPSDRMHLVGAVGIPLAALALTFAAIDWMMSLAPGWSSSVFGVYYFAGAMVSALALIAVLAGKRRLARGRLSPTTEHFQALGRLTLAFVLFWTYIWYAQFFIIWIADIPAEATWYIARLSGGWGAAAVALLVAGFAVPFLVLVFHAARGSAAVMHGLGVWLLAVHYLDLYWIIVPARPGWSPIDILWGLGALALVAGTTATVAILRQAGVPSVPIGDPLLAWSVRYEAH